MFLAITYFVFPETRGYSLEEIAEVFDGPRTVDIETQQHELGKRLQEERIDKLS